MLKRDHGLVLSQGPAYLGGCPNEEGSFLTRQLAAHRHEAAVRRDQESRWVYVAERRPDAVDDNVHGLGRSLSWIDAAEHDKAPPAAVQDGRVVAAACELERETSDRRVQQHVEQFGVFVLMLEPARPWIAIAKMHESRDRDALQAAVQSLDAVIRGLLVIARHGWLVDLD